jgi:hypothetical protein
MHERTKHKLMMEQQLEVDEMFSRRKKCWLSYGRAILTIAILGLLTVSLYTLTKSNSETDEEHISKHEIIPHDSEEVTIFKSSHKRNTIIVNTFSDDNIKSDGHKIVKRNSNAIQKKNFVTNVTNKPKIEYDSYTQNVQNSIPKLDSFHSNLFRRQGLQERIEHRHSDGTVYYLKGYKCVPIQKSPDSSSPVELKKPGRCKIIFRFPFYEMI